MVSIRRREKVKVLPANIADLVTPRALAYWLAASKSGAGPDKGTARQLSRLRVKVTLELGL